MNHQLPSTLLDPNRSSFILPLLSPMSRQATLGVTIISHIDLTFALSPELRVVKIEGWYSIFHQPVFSSKQGKEPPTHVID
jgi:hypothetical protein